MTYYRNKSGRVPEGAAHDYFRQGLAMRAARIVALLADPGLETRAGRPCRQSGREGAENSTGLPVTRSGALCASGDMAGIAARRFARIRREVVEVELRSADAPPSRPLDHLNDLAAPDPDPHCLWRARWDDLLADTTPISRKGARERADLVAAVAEWSFANPHQSIRVGGALILRALHEHRQGEPFGRALGLEPASGLTARTAINLATRNSIFRAARAASPAWRDAPARQAALLMSASFARYIAGPWLADRRRATAPAVEPAASWWRICSLDLKTKMPGCAHLASILEQENGSRGVP